MAYEHDRELQLSYEPERGHLNFVLYTESPGNWESAINATLMIQHSSSPYAAEWLSRLDNCEPDATHLTLIPRSEGRKLWDPCVYEDPESPAADGDGCTCYQTFRDPRTWLPVVARHHGTAGGDSDRWDYWTYAPLSLGETERLEVLIIDHEADAFWARTSDGALHLLPQRETGYSVGYPGSMSSDFAGMVTKIVDSEGYDVAAGRSRTEPSHVLLAWAGSKAADRTQELRLDQLQLLCRTGKQV